MRYHIPQIIMACLLLFSLMLDSYRHGKVREKKENVYSTLIAVAFNVALLWWGGFWQ